MQPTTDWLLAANKQIHQALLALRPRLLETQGHIEHQLKSDQSAVTKMDLLVEQTLQQKLQAIDSGIAFSGEETGVDYTKPTFWLVDPIDGTEPFMRGLPFATTMLTLIDNDQPIMSVIYNFALDEYYLAIKGQGASCNGHPIRVSQRSFDRSFIVLAGEFPDTHGCQHNLLRSQVRSLPRLNASGFEFTALARGALEGVVALNSRGKPWDFAPTTLMAREAGARVENIDTPGTHYYQNPQIVAASPVVFDRLYDFARSAAGLAQPELRK